MVAAELVGAGEGLGEGVAWRSGGVDLEGGRAGHGEDLGGCYGKREDIGDVGCWGLAWVVMEG